MRWLALLLAFTLGACDDASTGDDPSDAALPDAAPESCPAAQAIVGDCPEGMPAEAAIVVIDTLVFAEVDPAANAVAGFDLDARVSAADDTESCNQADFVAPDGREGIDNQLASLWPTIQAVTGDAVGGLIQGAINNGDLLIGLGITLDGDQVTLGVQTLRGNPLIGTDAKLLSHQTFTRDTESASSTATGVREGEWLVAGPFEIVLPLVILSFELDLVVSGAYLRVRYDADGHIQGSLGGGISVEQFMGALSVADVPEGLISFVRTTLQSRADLDRDDSGMCRGLSAGLVFNATPAWVADW